MAMKTPVSTSKLDDDEIDIGVLLARLWAGKLWIVLFTTLAATAGLIFALGTPPTYRADAMLQLEEKTGQLALPAALTELTSSDPRSVTEIEILNSRMVLGQAVADAHVDWNVTPRRLPMVLTALAKVGAPIPENDLLAAYVREGEQIRLDLLEVPARWIGRDILLKVGPDGRFTLQLPDGSARESQIDETLTESELGFALRIGVMEAVPGREFIIRHLSENAAIRNLRGRLAVAERGRQSGILELSLTGPDLEGTERTLNAITQAYLRQNISRSAAEAESSLAFVESQIPAAEAMIQTAERALNDYRQQQQAIDLGFEGQSLLTQISGLEDQLQQLVGEEETLAERYTPNHPAYQQLLSERARLEERLERLRSDVANLPETQREVLNLTRDFELAQEVYLELLNRAQELRVMRASTIGNVRIVDTATTDDRPVAPRRARILALSLVLGAFAGIGFVLIQNALRRGIQSAEEITSLGLPVFATINLNDKSAKNTKRTGKLPILSLTDPNDLTVEGFRSLRTSLHFAMLDASSRSITLTSAAPEAGKSFTSVNLAVVAAQAGQSVCLVDADLRRGHLRRYFDVPKAHLGLGDYLAGRATLDDIIIQTAVPGLCFISTGRFPPNPSELLMRGRFRDLVTELDSLFDVSIFDSPPALAVTDPIIIGNATGATIAVIRFDKTTANEIEAVQLQLEQGGAKLSGAILNGFDPRRVQAGYSYGYSYRYEYQRSEEPVSLEPEMPQRTVFLRSASGSVPQASEEEASAPLVLNEDARVSSSQAFPFVKNTGRG
ncbi:polysaccharide biosynthesis tyrosine autokinase [Seohaeicola saemankumensis]|uniref:Polysaccharide biosynthesis tyrosine autokinase n=1 Tax=Seohaeicola saemankumensis TaxID=481181 RepID=A0ABW3TDZ0_9RHOB